MLSAIKNIGEIVCNKSLQSERHIEGKIIFIILDIDNLSFETDIEDFDSGKREQYLFQEGSTKGRESAPFAPLTDSLKTYEKLETWFKNCEQIETLSKEDNNFLKKINNVLKDSKEPIINSIQEINKNLTKKKGEGRYLSLGFKGENRYLGKYEVLHNCLKKLSDEKMQKSAGSNQACSICGLERDEVIGKSDVFKFYTIDKPGFIAGGFKESLAWKNFPVCLDCMAFLEKGKKFIDSKLNFKFYGLNYYLIPRLLIGGENILQEILEILQDTKKIVSLKERIKKKITNDENEIFEYLADLKDTMTLNFLFLKKDKSAERILLLIEDVLPSRIQKIFETKEKVEAVFNNEEYNFGRLRTFLSKSDKDKRENDLNKYFLEIVDAIFKGKKIDFVFYLKFFMAVIRREFIDENYFSFRVKDALMDTIFFSYLDLIAFEEVNMEESIFDNVFNRYEKSFKTPAKRGIFLLGALTEMLLRKQYADRNSKPFIKKLKSLKMDEKDLKALLPEVQNKLEEYDSFDKGKRQIASEAAKYLLESGEEWKMSVDEINFYFACGMNLVEDIANIVYPKTNI